MHWTITRSIERQSTYLDRIEHQINTFDTLNKRIGAYGHQLFYSTFKANLTFFQYSLTIEHLSTGKYKPYFCFSYNHIIYSLLRVSTHSPFVSITSYLYWINNIEETNAIKTCSKMLYSYQNIFLLK